MKDKAKKIPGGIIAAGDETTARAAIRILENGGNAFDAAIAATFTSFVSESTLTSAGGGGFCMAHTASGEQILFDFFTKTPSTKIEPDHLEIIASKINFQDSVQEFKIGLGTATVPGNIAGLFHIHKRLGSLPFHVLLGPAIDAARNGVAISPFIRGNFHVINDILLAEMPSRNIYKPGGKLLQVGDKYYLKNYATMLEILSKEGPDAFYKGKFAEDIVRDSVARGGHLRMLDFQNYQVEERVPLHFRYRGFDFYTNPPPSSGGILIAFMLNMLENVPLKRSQYGSSFHLKCLIECMRLAAEARTERLNKSRNKKNAIQKFLKPEYLEKYGHLFQSKSSKFRNTTHLTVADRIGNVASISTSFGTGCGYIMPGTDSMLNNMLGEEDLNPSGFNNWKEGQHITSMMAPTIVLKEGIPVLALGSGGANRIRTAIMQVISNVIDFEMEPDQAVNSPRIHWEDDIVSFEPGFNQKEIKFLEKESSFDVVPYQSNNIFFGGVHTVKINPSWHLVGAGDRRRQGIVLSC